MAKKSKREQDNEESCEPLESGQMPEQSGKKVQVNYNPAPGSQSPAKKIHPRQQMPPLPDGEEVPDNKPSPPVDLD